MRRLLQVPLLGRAVLGFLLFILVQLGSSIPALAIGTDAVPEVRQASCQFRLGFKTIKDTIPDIVGACLENEHHNPANGDALQQTTKGMLAWRKSDNFTAFTDGHRSWVNGPNGLQSRLNTERFSWENNPASTASAAPRPPAPAPSPVPGPRIVAPSTPTTARPAPSPSPAPRNLESFVRSVGGNLNDFWKETFSGTSVRYRSPKLSMASRTVRSDCGTATTDTGPGYCRRDETISMPLDFLIKDIGWPDNDASIAMVVAHEWAHHAQKLIGITLAQRELGFFTIQIELQADCFTGAFMDFAGTKTWFKREGLEDVVASLAELGDPRSVPWFDPQAHGTSAQRVAAMLKGYRKGAVACLDFTPIDN
jgi:predicted metalloprotease